MFLFLTRLNMRIYDEFCLVKVRAQSNLLLSDLHLFIVGDLCIWGVAVPLILFIFVTAATILKYVIAAGHEIQKLKMEIQGRTSKIF